MDAKLDLEYFSEIASDPITRIGKFLNGQLNRRRRNAMRFKYFNCYLYIQKFYQAIDKIDILFNI